MREPVLVIGNKNYSSWSLRPWLALRVAGIPFREVKVLLDQPDTAAAIAEWSPSGRVPALEHEGLAVWESLAIVEYANELYPDAGLWPADRRDRARARSYASEMHAGFATLRQQMPMDTKGRYPGVGMNDAVRADIDRIEAIWAEALTLSGGPYLFGERPNAADAFYAPVVIRFRTYAPALTATSQAYVAAILALPAMVEWEEGTVGEEEVPRYVRR